ncbi:hypothetical protein ACFVVA_36975 [Kitasatospora sp. NPDC058048]|uniref:hypothetical protein n=1 Tax=Kitasatospora sp. NPDC058048 TaxID=3346313 RepID=UPI0036DDCC20
MQTTYRVGIRVTHDAAPDHGTIRLITPADDGTIRLHVEFDRAQGRTESREADELTPVIGAETRQAVPDLAPGVRVQRTISYRTPYGSCNPRTIIERGTYVGRPRGGADHAVQWDASARPELTCGEPEFHPVDPNHLQIERDEWRYAIGDRVDVPDYRGATTVRAGRVLEFRRHGDQRQARVRLDGATCEPVNPWRDVLDLHPMHGHQLSIEYFRRRAAGQSRRQAGQVYYGDHHAPDVQPGS